MRWPGLNVASGQNYKISGNHTLVLLLFLFLCFVFCVHFRFAICSSKSILSRGKLLIKETKWAWGFVWPLASVERRKMEGDATGPQFILWINSSSSSSNSSSLLVLLWSTQLSTKSRLVVLPFIITSSWGLLGVFSRSVSSTQWHRRPNTQCPRLISPQDLGYFRTFGYSRT